MNLSLENYNICIKKDILTTTKSLTKNSNHHVPGIILLLIQIKEHQQMMRMH